METIQLEITNMKSAHCMMVVTNTLKEMSGVTLKKISSGFAEIELTGVEKASVVSRIEKAGYTVANK